MSQTWTDDDNPYAPPQAGREPVPVFRTNPDAERLEVEVVHRGWLSRAIRFQGRHEGVVEWCGAGSWETVSIDGAVIRSELNLSLWNALIPRFDVPVDTGYPATLCIEVRVLGIFFLRAFRIRLDGRTLFEEGHWPPDPPAEGALEPDRSHRKAP
jgi:hypothetical protein